MTTTPTNTSNNALEYAVNNNIVKLAKWVLMKPVKPDNIEECLNLAISKNVDKDIIDLLVSEIGIEIGLPKTIVESIKSKIVESDIKNNKIEEVKPEFILYYDIMLNGINLKGITINKLIYDLMFYPKIAKNQLRKNVYSLEELNYRTPLNGITESSSGITILHILCSGNSHQYQSDYEDILEYLLTKTRIDINIRNKKGYTAFMLATSCRFNKISDKIFRLFLDHPEFKHDDSSRSMSIIEKMRYLGNNQAIYLLLEHSKTIYGLVVSNEFFKTKEGFMSNMLKYCKRDSLKNFELFEKIMSNPNIKFESYDWVFKGLKNIEEESEKSNICKYFEIVAKSKRMGLDVWKDLKQNIADDDLKSKILKLYIQYYPDGIY
jgi:ankyrin repeat protein